MFYWVIFIEEHGPHSTLHACCLCTCIQCWVFTTREHCAFVTSESDWTLITLYIQEITLNQSAFSDLPLIINIMHGKVHRWNPRDFSSCYTVFIDGRSVHITYRYPVGSDDVNIETQWNLHLYVPCLGTPKKLENTTKKKKKKN